MWALIETRVGNRYNGKVVKTREFEMGEGDPYGLSSRVGACLKSSSGRAPSSTRERLDFYVDLVQKVLDALDVR